MIQTLFEARHSLPTILQAERTECGLACLSMVASYYGRNIDLNTLRREHAVSAHGSSLKDILNIANALSLNTRPVKIELEELDKLQLPAILHWDMTHFVVLRKVTRQNMVVHDPASGVCHYTIKEASRHFTGVAVEFTPGVDFKPQTQQLTSRLQDLFDRYPGFYSALAQLFGLSLFLQFASIVSAFYVQLVIDEGIVAQDRDFLTVLAIGFFMLALTNVGMNYARANVQLYFANQLGFQMVSNVFVHLFRLPVEFFEKRHVGDLVSRFGSVREIRRIITEDLLAVILDGGFAIFTLGVMFYFNSLLTVVVLSFVLVVTILKIVLIPRVKSLQEQKIVAEAKTDSNLMEGMRTIEIIKFYCQELPRVMHWRNCYAEQINSNVALARFSMNMDAVYGVLFSAENILVIYLAAVQVVQGDVSLGFLTAFIALKGNFSTSVRSFVEKIVQIRLVKLQLERVSDITCTAPEFETLYLPAQRKQVRGNLTLANVSYAYPGVCIPTFKDISLDIAAGEIIAIVGASGSGKSTLLKVMAGLLEPKSGSLKVDGVDVRQFGKRQFRDVCAGVLQTDQLLSGSIRDNITMFADDVDSNRLHRAAGMAQIDSYIGQMPMGYNSLIGDMGSIMSSGQEQRILLARAFYKAPSFYFLDEATANLDPQVEIKILEALAQLKTTVVMITHRPAPLEFADRIFQFANALSPRDYRSKNLRLSSTRVLVGGECFVSGIRSNVIAGI